MTNKSQIIKNKQETLQITYEQLSDTANLHLIKRQTIQLCKHLLRTVKILVNTFQKYITNRF